MVNQNHCGVFDVETLHGRFRLYDGLVCVGLFKRAVPPNATLQPRPRLRGRRLEALVGRSRVREKYAMICSGDFPASSAACRSRTVFSNPGLSLNGR
jgi:hypothetical protein